VGESCRIHADIDEDLLDYIKLRYDRESPKRFAIFPFEVPDNFFPPVNNPGSSANDTSQELARRLQAALVATQELGIVEVFNRFNWQGKRDEFFKGNYSAIEQARAAGYDFLIVGMLEPITDDTTLRFQTKLIDAAANTTVWSGLTEVHSNERAWNRGVLGSEMFKTRFDNFNFRERFENYARCTAKRVVFGKEDQPQ